MKSEDPVVIIGGGYSGTMIAAELARRGIGCVIVEGGGRQGRGTAYSTLEDAHLLNLTAARMGAWADRPGDFAEVVAADGYAPSDYVPRRRFGEYLSRILDGARASGLVSLVAGMAHAAEPNRDGWTIGLADGSKLAGRALVLAQGNQSPATPPFARGLPAELYVNDPWSEAGREAIAGAAGNGGDVLIIGTGLTMVDVVLSLDEARHRGRITALSRRGLVPRAHADHNAAPIDWFEVPKGSLLKLWRWLRRASAAHGWRAVLDLLRPHNQELWQSFSGDDRRRFLRHARPWWDVHRHRIAPQVSGRLHRLLQLGQLEIVAGRIVDMWVGNQGLGVAIKRRGRTEAMDHHFALAVNCTGPLGSIAETKDPLLAS
ncbi:MAG TPA: FAD/NAD(P)-binding protein, partial [Sphingomicrobium sp.]|nr:FAD/NAD(P)-binding protein [Sphingomicrobium sp.]